VILIAFLVVNCFSQTEQRERYTLEAKRLDLDAAKNRLKKAKTAQAQMNVSHRSFFLPVDISITNRWLGTETICKHTRTMSTLDKRSFFHLIIVHLFH
jgi:hypothetical protein